MANRNKKPLTNSFARPPKYAISGTAADIEKVNGLLDTKEIVYLDDTRSILDNNRKRREMVDMSYHRIIVVNMSDPLNCISVLEADNSHLSHNPADIAVIIVTPPGTKAPSLEYRATWKLGRHLYNTVGMVIVVNELTQSVVRCVVGNFLDNENKKGKFVYGDKSETYHSISTHLACDNSQYIKLGIKLFDDLDEISADGINYSLVTCERQDTEAEDLIEHVCHVLRDCQVNQHIPHNPEDLPTASFPFTLTVNKQWLAQLQEKAAYSVTDLKDLLSRALFTQEKPDPSNELFMAFNAFVQSQETPKDIRIDISDDKPCIIWNGKACPISDAPSFL